MFDHIFNILSVSIPGFLSGAKNVWGSQLWIFGGTSAYSVAAFIECRQINNNMSILRLFVNAQHRSYICSSSFLPSCKIFWLILLACFTGCCVITVFFLQFLLMICNTQNYFFLFGLWSFEENFCAIFTWPMKYLGSDFQIIMVLPAVWWPTIISLCVSIFVSLVAPPA